MEVYELLGVIGVSIFAFTGSIGVCTWLLGLKQTIAIRVLYWTLAIIAGNSFAANLFAAGIL